jgi:hypothetical protein
MTPSTSKLVPKLRESTARAKLVTMLRNTLRNYPSARLWRFRGGFGVSLDGHTYLRVSYAGAWTPEDMRDLLALLATWCVADPQRIMCVDCQRPIGHSAGVIEREFSSRMPQD